MNRLNRTNLILLGVLALQIVLAVVMFLPKQSSSASAGAALFEGVKAEDIVRVTLIEAQGGQIELLKKDGEWALPAADNYPVLKDKAGTLTAKLVGLKSNRLVAQDQTSLKRLKVADDDFLTFIEFETADAKVRQFYMGSSPAWSVAHVRLPGQTQVYLVSGLSISDVDTSATAWIDTKLLAVTAEQVTSVTFQNQKGTVAMTRGTAGKWAIQGAPAGEPLDDAKIATLLSHVANLYVQRPLGTQAKSEYGLDKPTASVAVTTSSTDAKTASYTFQVGALSPEGGSYALFSSVSPYYIYIADYAVEEVVSYTVKDFLVLPEPTPPAGTPQAK